jgi:drug/metabolite transporter (DMT)-like permease
VGLGFGVYLAGVSRIPALAAALLGLLEIPLAPVWAFMLFDEDLGLKTLFGGALVVIASLIYILGTARRRNS